MEQENKVVNVAYSEPKDNTNSEFTIISYQNENSSGNKTGVEVNDYDYLLDSEHDTTTDDDLQQRTLKKDKRKTKKMSKIKHSGATKRGVKYFGGGVESKYIVWLPHNKVLRKERIRNRLEKCSKFIENNNSDYSKIIEIVRY